MRVCSVAVRGAGAVSGGQLAGGGAGILGHTTGRSGRWLVAGGWWRAWARSNKMEIWPRVLGLNLVTATTSRATATHSGKYY